MNSKIHFSFIIICFCWLFPDFTYSQGEWNNWIFGHHAGITFNFGTPVPITTVSPFYYARGGTLTVSDSSGNLLFYAENYINLSEYVFNRNNVQMPNGNLYNGTYQNNPQPFFSVQNLTDDSSYYLFSMIDPWPMTGAGGLFYSVLDMRLDGGLGDIVPGQKSVPIYSARHTASVLTGTRHHNNKDAWIIVHNHTNSNSYLSYLVNSSGIDTTPIVSPSFVVLADSNFSRLSTIKISPDGTKLICLADTNAEYCSFNTLTGVITHLFKINFNQNQNFGQFSDAEFSIDNKYLYISESGSVPTGSKLYQFDATKTDSTGFKQSQILISSEPYLWNQYFSGLQRGPDNKIYCAAMDQTDSISVINNPTLQGTACNYQKNAICLLPTNEALFGFPQFLQKYKAYIHHTGLCQYDSIHFASDIWPPADSIHWDFGDPVSGPSNSSNLANPSHIYSNVGTYTVELFVKHIDHRTDTTWQTITILASPQVNLGPNRTVCTGDSVTFDAGACSGCTYLWKDLGTGLTVGTSQLFKTGLAGNYSVTVTNTDGCNGADTVQLITTPVPSVTNDPVSDTICSGESTNIALYSTVNGTNFHWTASLTSGNITGFSADSGLVINQVLTDLLPTPGIVTYHITPKIGSCAGTTVDFPVTVNPGDSVKVSITASANNICEGRTVTFTAFPTHPGLNPTYHWKVNGINSGTNSTTFSYTPLNNDIVSCELTSSLTVCISNNPATSNSITMVVYQNLAVSITISPDADTVCTGSTVTFTAYPIHGGITPSYQWKLNGANAGTNNFVYSFIPIDGDLVSCILTSSDTCVTNNPASSIQHQITVSPLLLVSISISPSSNPFCVGSSVTFTASPTHGGFTPSYQWKVNGANAGTNSDTFTYYPVNNDVVWCILTSSELCTTNNPASSIQHLMIENTSLVAGVSIVATSNPFCPGSSVTFTATPINGGTPIYQWKVNGINVGTNLNTYSYNPVDGDSVRCIMTSDMNCVTGNPASSNKIIMSGTLAPIVTFASCFDTITTINAKPIKLKGGIPLGGTYSGPGVNSITGVFMPLAAGTGIKTITYSYTNAALCSASKSRAIIVQPAPVFTCGNNLTDIRDNKVYSTVHIGSQCWLASNLNYGVILASTQDQRDNCVAEKYCYNDNPTNCTNHGGLYQWDEVMRFDETPADQGFCPPGWHIPSENDWNTLFAVFINNGFAGSPLKYSGYSGFNALLSGTRHINKSWDYQGFATFFWSSTLRSDKKAWAHGLNDVDPSVSRYPSSRVNAFSVRCLKD